MGDPPRPARQEPAAAGGQNPRRQASRVKKLLEGRGSFKEMQCLLLENSSQELYACACIIIIGKARRKRIEKGIGVFLFQNDGREIFVSVEW